MIEQEKKMGLPKQCLNNVRNCCFKGWILQTFFYMTKDACIWAVMAITLWRHVHMDNWNEILCCTKESLVD